MTFTANTVTNLFPMFDNIQIRLTYPAIVHVIVIHNRPNRFISSSRTMIHCTRCSCNTQGDTHTGETPSTQLSKISVPKPCRRSVCGKKIGDKTVLQKCEKPHERSICGEIFLNKSNPRNDMRSYSGEILFGCIICGKKICPKGSLTVHMLKMEK